MTVEYYGVGVENGIVTESGDGRYIIVAKNGETLVESELDFAVSKEAYRIEIAADGKSATIALNVPVFGQKFVTNEVEKAIDDASGILVIVDESQIYAKPVAKDGEVVGALPIKTYPGLYYQAAWGDSLDNLTTGAKVQATTDTLYLGVIKQTGTSGFYKVTVSEQ